MKIDEVVIYDDMTPKEKLMLRNLKLVPYVYNKYFKHQTFIEYEDMIGYGYIGLWRAAVNFNRNKGKFSTYAVAGIWSSMFVALRDKSGSISSRSSREKLNINQPLPFSYFDTESKTGNKELNVIENIPLTSYLDLEELIDYQKIKETLNEKELLILKSLEEDINQVDIAKELNVSQATVSRNQKKLIKKIRKAMED